MKTVILFAFLAAAHQAWACKCVTATLDRLTKDPLSAETVFFAEAHVKPGSQFLQVTHSWEMVGKNIELDAKTSCRPFLQDNKRYLVLGAEKDRYHSCGTVFLQLSKAQAPLQKLLKRQPHQLQPHPVWLTCQADAQCVLTKDLCGGEMAVNKLHLKEQQNYVKEHAPKVNCVQAGAALKLQAVCDDGLCLAKPDQL